MSESIEKSCPDCNEAMTEIRLIDKAHSNVHQDVEYALAVAKRGFWLGRFPVEGKVAAFMCGQCGRIILYGKPKEES